MFNDSKVSKLVLCVGDGSWTIASAFAITGGVRATKLLIFYIWYFCAVFFFVIVVVIIIIMSRTNWLDFLFVVFPLLRRRRRRIRRKIIETAFTDWDASLSLNLLSRSFHSIPFHFVCICLNTLNFISFFSTFCKFSTQKSTIIPSNLSESMNLI